MGHSRYLFVYFSLFYTVNSELKSLRKNWWGLDSNPGPLVAEATSVKTVSQSITDSLANIFDNDLLI